MARRPGSDGTKTDQAIRDAAIELIARHGFEALTLRQLAERVGLQVGSLYRYFPSKAALLVSLLVEHLQFLLGAWAAARPLAVDDDDPRQRLLAFVAFHIRSHTLRRQAVFVSNVELRSLAPHDYASVVALRRQYEQQLIDVLMAGARAGDFRLANVKLSAYAILAMLTGVGVWYRSDGELDTQQVIALHQQLVMQTVGVVTTGEAALAASQSSADPSIRRQAGA